MTKASCHLTFGPDRAIVVVLDMPLEPISSCHGRRPRNSDPRQLTPAFMRPTSPQGEAGRVKRPVRRHVRGLSRE
jgi:hypothetical protein